MHQPIPAFEGHPVDAAIVKITGTAPADDLADVILGVDDAFQMLTMYRCVGVSHAVDEKTGLLTRIHHVKPIEMTLAPIDPSDASDEGIIRALPRGNS